MSAFSVLLLYYDLETLTLPDMFVGILGVWATIGILAFLRDTIEVRLLAGLGAALLFLILYGVSRGRWIGGGDVKLAGVLGFWVGSPEVLVFIGGAYVIGALVALMLLITGRARFGNLLPFSPFLLVGSHLAFYRGEEIARWYVNLIT
jgi:leader peptidase (prepilin peptidase)/N-methyltransferase